MCPKPWKLRLIYLWHEMALKLIWANCRPYRAGIGIYSTCHTTAKDKRLLRANQLKFSSLGSGQADGEKLAAPTSDIDMSQSFCFTAKYPVDVSQFLLHDQTKHKEPHVNFSYAHQIRHHSSATSSTFDSSSTSITFLKQSSSSSSSSSVSRSSSFGAPYSRPWRISAALRLSCCGDS